MENATLIIMAAGIGSRFGSGIKQLEPVGPKGEIIMDYSIRDAVKAGFNKVVVVIRRDLEKDFKEVIGNRIEKLVDVEYAYQELTDIPEKYKEKLQDRKKPWGTGQAILCCKDLVHNPFLIINADDYYGQEAYVQAYQYLTKPHVSDSKLNICMIGFELKNTLSDNGGVTRGICQVNGEGFLTDIVETHNIFKKGGKAKVIFEEEEHSIDLNKIVSMNMWGMSPEFFDILEIGFNKFLEDLSEEDKKKEYLLPTIIGDLLKEKKVHVKVLQSKDKWFGVTYKEDKASVAAAIKNLIDKGLYT